jgi:hypothetical protein
MRTHHRLIVFLFILIAAGVNSSVGLSVSPAAEAAVDGPLARGIENLKNIQQKRRTQIEELDDEAEERVASVVEIVYDGYGHERDPGRQLIELKGTLEETVALIRAGRMGEVAEALGHASQLALDVWSDKDPRVNHLNVGQQIAWELAEAAQILRERAAREREITRDDQILQWLEAKNAALKSRDQNKTPKPPKEGRDKPVPPPRGGVNPAVLDEAERLQRWLDLGNRSFDNKAQENQFYRDYPMLNPLRDIADTRSPADEADEMDALRLIEQASAEARRRRAELKAEDQQREQADQDVDSARRELAQALEDERNASAPQRITIPEGILRRTIPAGWVPCQCPGRHPNAGLLIEGQRWHTPAIDCSMIF